MRCAAASSSGPCAPSCSGTAQAGWFLPGRQWRRALVCQALAAHLEQGLLGGAVIAEVILGVPGLGRLLHTAVVTSDVPMFQGGLLVAVAAGIAIGLVGDGLSALLSPPERER